MRGCEALTGDVVLVDETAALRLTVVDDLRVAVSLFCVVVVVARLV